MGGEGNSLGSPPSLGGFRRPDAPLEPHQPALHAVTKYFSGFFSSVVMETGCPRAAELLNPGCARRAGRQGIPLCSFKAA